MRKNKKSSNKKRNLKLIIIISVLIAAQFVLNCFFFWKIQVLNNETSSKVSSTTLLIRDAISGLNELKTELNEANTIPELRLQFPDSSEEIGQVIYLYDGYANYVEITSKAIANYGLTKIHLWEPVDEVFDNVPEAQACNRGFSLTFDNNDEFGGERFLAGKKDLSDGRTLYVWREPACNFEVMDLLQDYLLKAESL